MMKVKGIFAVSLIAMVAVVAGTHTSNAVAAIASKGYVDQQIDTKVATAQGSAAANKAVITNSSGNITTGQIASGMIANDAVTSAKLAAGAVDATALASGAVTSAKIADGTITNADIATNAAIAPSKVDGLAKVATSGLYNDLTGKPTIPTVNNATLTIQKNGDTVDTFTANASANKTINITVPTKTSELDNDSGFVTSANLPVATEDTLGGVKSGGDITVDTSGAVTVKSAARADSATTATNAKTATHDADGNVITDTYAKKSDIPTASDILTTTTVTSQGTGAVLTGVSVEDGKVTLQKGNVQIPSGGQNATSYVSIWVE